MGTDNSIARRIKRKKRVRRRVKGSPEKPRLCVFRSSRHIYAQLIDDDNGRTLLQASSLSKDLVGSLDNNGGNKKGAAVVGSALGKAARAGGFEKIAFDRNGFLYHGRVKALAEAARESGLKF